MAYYKSEEQAVTGSTSSTINGRDSTLILGRIEETVAQEGFTKIMKDKPNLFYRRIGKSPPPEFRWLAWRVSLKVSDIVIVGLYTELLQGAQSKWEYTIEKDLNRTFPLHPFFDLQKHGEIGQSKLFRVLKAYSLYNTQVGYCQSLNFLAGFLLILSGGREEESFWVLVSLTMKHFHPNNLGILGISGFFQNNFPLLGEFIYIFRRIFQKKIAKTYIWFEECGVPDELWIHKWMQTLFLYSFPMHLCIRIWDNIISGGVTFIFQSAISIIKSIKGDLLGLELQEIRNYLDELKGNSKLVNVEKIISESMKLKLSKEVLEGYRGEFKKRVKNNDLESGIWRTESPIAMTRGRVMSSVGRGEECDSNDNGNSNGNNNGKSNGKSNGSNGSNGSNDKRVEVEVEVVPRVMDDPKDAIPLSKIAELRRGIASPGHSKHQSRGEIEEISPFKLAKSYTTPPRIRRTENKSESGENVRLPPINVNRVSMISLGSDISGGARSSRVSRASRRTEAHQSVLILSPKNNVVPVAVLHSQHEESWSGEQMSSRVIHYTQGKHRPTSGKQSKHLLNVPIRVSKTLKVLPNQTNHSKGIQPKDEEIYDMGQIQEVPPNTEQMESHSPQYLPVTCNHSDSASSEIPSIRSLPLINITNDIQKNNWMKGSFNI